MQVSQCQKIHVSDQDLNTGLFFGFQMVFYDQNTGISNQEPEDLFSFQMVATIWKSRPVFNCMQFLVGILFNFFEMRMSLQLVIINWDQFSDPTCITDQF